MKDLNYELKALCHRNHDGSFATQANRQHILNQIADDLHQLGFRHLQVISLKTKHVEKLIEHWQKDDISVGTIKNRMAALRWWAEKIGKPGIVRKSNQAYGIPERIYVTNADKSRELSDGDLSQITDERVRASLELQAAFGLRREESIKFIPSWADRGDKIALKGSWCKNGRPREIVIRTSEQRALLDRLKTDYCNQSLIPPDKTYVQQLNRFIYQCRKAGIQRVHGHRHRYAQNRYEEITGWQCPAAGGIPSNQLTPEQKEKDRTARLLISNELGHERESITAQYLGR